AMYLLDLAGQADQFGQLLAVPVVVADQNVVDKLRRTRPGPVAAVAVTRPEGQQAAFDRGRIKRFLLGGLAQALLAAATKVQVVFVENSGGARDGARQLAKRPVYQIHEALLSRMDTAIDARIVPGKITVISTTYFLKGIKYLTMLRFLIPLTGKNNPISGFQLYCPAAPCGGQAVGQARREGLFQRHRHGPRVQQADQHLGVDADQVAAPTDIDVHARV